ncbi:hypothetical protein Cgig2_031714 [Carnegiea gigantea]|uniref:Uncharacterized protein n=1 Tax=Carnegiea gigantea TaxID=171969 RepID=A0A9Q1QPJ5_9CARY|nr:hypothetical protein Cgig2_031714 [Carnegiea gigantea]
MSIPKLSLSCFLLLLLVVVFLVAPIHGLEESRKLDEAGSTDPSIKCGGCSSPCGATCYLSPPPPPPQVYLPPPPPPPHKKPPKTRYCPPPPYSPGFIYTGAPPGSLYPVDQNYSGSTRIFSSSVFPPLGHGLLSLLIMCWPASSVGDSWARCTQWCGIGDLIVGTTIIVEQFGGRFGRHQMLKEDESLRGADY